MNSADCNAVEKHSVDGAAGLRNGIAKFSKEVERRSEEMRVEDKELLRREWL